MRKASYGLLSALSLVVVLMFSGCATTKEVAQLRTDVQKASDNAASARTTADAAMKEATAAKNSADDAKAAAERAEKAAMDAKAASEATDAKIDNMFKKSMQKSG